MTDSGTEQERRVIIEMERSVDCAEAQWHTRHDERKYDMYEQKFKEELATLCADRDYVYVRNPGPKARGMNCKQSIYCKKLWHSMVKNEKTQKWSPDVTFCYPRVGAFEVTVVKGKQRIPVFSKLTIRKWPNPIWLANKVDQAVTHRLTGAWAPAPVEVKKERKYATSKITDEELRNKVMGKFTALCAAFKSFDKNGDGCISKGEFAKGLRSCGIDLPPAQIKQLWRMADEDNTGYLLYQEFARRFSTYKATGSLHRATSFRDDGHQKNVKNLHGVGATTRVQKTTAIRGAENEVSWGVEGDALAEDGEAHLKNLNKKSLSIQQLSRMPEIINKPVEDCKVSEIMAKIYKKHGSLLNAWRHFDLDGSNSVDHSEFLHHLPKVLGEAISVAKCNALWAEFDPDMSGTIDGDEFCNRKEINDLATQQGVNTLKGMAFDPTMQAENMKHDQGAMVAKQSYGAGGNAGGIVASKAHAEERARAMAHDGSGATMATISENK